LYVAREIFYRILLIVLFVCFIDDWGIRVERMELLDLRYLYIEREDSLYMENLSLQYRPKEDFREVMNKQMIAERTRRGDFIRSEGKKVTKKICEYKLLAVLM
jgi:regulator of protease activity HflC (stomatin/prohibitin superfamily)